jgi:hypothetical protein
MRIVEPGRLVSRPKGVISKIGLGSAGAACVAV